MWNIIIGIAFIAGGLSGNLALRGTNSGPALAALGGGLVIWGIIQVVRAQGGNSAQGGESPPDAPETGSPQSGG